jgi:16S rRNA (cytosine1402-N4)-methyltransferase
MNTRHQPVMLTEVLDYLLPTPGKVVVDMTLGGGGYSAACLEAGARVIGLDLDLEAIAGASERLSSHGDRFIARHTAFSSFGAVLDELGISHADGICMDLGLSSDQLEDAGRGFSHQAEGPFDLRFDASRGNSAAQHLRGASVSQIQTWLSEYGEVRVAGRVARALHELAREGKALSAVEVKEKVLSVLPRGAKKEAELARVFQAFRILVNDEMGELDAALREIPARLRSGGRFVAVSYHSLEDRRVKTMLRRESRGAQGSRHLPPLEDRTKRLKVLTPRPVRPTLEEIRRNSRARSARLRAAEGL